MTPCPVSREALLTVSRMLVMRAMSLLPSSVRPVMEQVSIPEIELTRNLIFTVVAGTRVKFDDK